MKLFFTACLLVGVMVAPTQADIIYFKDGMKTICQQKAWEQDGEVKCEYAGWVITYRKEDVLRIVKTTPPKKPAPPADKTSLKPQVASAKPQKKVSPPKSGGVAFYDPRRPYKYWVSKKSKYKNFNQAIEALAKQYHHSPQWVQAHMGGTNDLAQIHQNLAHPDACQDLSIGKPAGLKKPGVIFYNPRRPYPYWTGRTSKHKTFKAAIKALASQYDRSAQWVQANMGATNDLNEIHHNLSSRITAEAGN